MAQKPTSLTALAAKQAAERRVEAEKEDAKASRRSAPPGKVWVRLIRPHYDSEGILHRAGVTLLPEGAIPSSAKVLTAKQAPALEEASEDEGDDA